MLGEEQNDWAQGKHSWGSPKCETLFDGASLELAVAASQWQHCVASITSSWEERRHCTYFGKAIASAEMRGGLIITVISGSGQAVALRARVLAVTSHLHGTPGAVASLQ